MKNKISSGIKNLFLGMILLLILTVIIFLGWLNHKDFIKTIITEQKEELLLLARAEAQSLEKQIINLDREEENIRNIISHIESKEKFYVLIFNSNGKIIIFPDRSFVGRNIFSVIKEIPERKINLDEENIFTRMALGEEGTAVFEFFEEDNTANFQKMLVAYVPIRIKDQLWSFVIFKELSVLNDPIKKNIRDTILICSFVCFTFCFWIFIFYRSQKQRMQLETAVTALEIINRQLHIHIDEKQRLEKELKATFGSSRKKIP